MAKYITNFLNRIQTTEKCFLILIIFFPISLILGNLIININFLLIFIIFLIDLSLNKNFSFIKDKIFILLIVFFLSLLVNLNFSIDPIISLPRILKILAVICMFLFFRKMIAKYGNDFENILFGSWAILFSILIIDIIFEIIFGFNTIGIKSIIPGRIASFFGNELVVGSFFLSFATIYIATIAKFSKTNINFKLIVLIIFLIFLSFLIGERSNFIKFFLISIFLLFFAIKLSFKIKIFSSLIIFCILFLSLNYFQDIKYRYYKQQIKNFQAETKKLNKADSQNILIDTKDNIINFFKWTKYGAHYNAAYKIFLENPYFGVGIKHFRNESIKEKYRNEEYKWTDERNTTHPHQIHFEFLSETGLFGYIIFIIFITTSLYLSIKNYLIHKNLFQLVTILYVLVSILPLLPSGSFFSTYSSSLFWLNYTIMVSYIKKIKS